MKFFYQLDKDALNDFQSIGANTDTVLLKDVLLKDNECYTRYEQYQKMTIVMDNVTLRVVTLGVSDLIIENVQ